MRRASQSFAFVLCGLVAGCAEGGRGGELEAAAITAAFQDGVAPTASYVGTRDSMLEQDDASATHGSDKKLSASGDTPGDSGEDDVIVVSWDLGAAIPRTAVVRAATITLTVSDKADQSYPVFEVVRGWDEATASWTRASSSASWATSGAAGATDRGTAQLGTLRAAATGTFAIPLSAAGIATVQRWVADPSTNHGIAIASTSNDNRLEIQSREGAKSGRPRLEIAWEPAGSGIDAGVGSGVDAGVGSGSDAGTDGGTLSLDPTPGTYRQTCDGSAAVALDFGHFLDFSDEDQVARIYARATSATPAQQVDISSAIGMASDDEADFEDAARVGDRIYAITSHGRDKDGDFAATRYRFVAIDVAGSVPAVQLSVAGSTSRLLTDLLAAANWDHPDPTVLAAIQASAQLSKASDSSLAPEANGLNIEGLAAYPSASSPDRLLIGLRNPRANGRAILITLLNPAQAVTGTTAHFGEVIALDLGGLGVRAITWSAAHQALLIIGGPQGDAGMVQLFKWSGDPAASPAAIQTLAGPAGSAAEAIVSYPGTKDVQILFDLGGVSVGGTDCKKLSTSAQSFTDQIIHVD